MTRERAGIFVRAPEGKIPVHGISANINISTPPHFRLIDHVSVSLPPSAGAAPLSIPQLYTMKREISPGGLYVMAYESLKKKMDG